MPRRGPDRTISAERNVARQVRMRREGEGMTYEGLAKRMADVGCPMQGTTVYKIERSDPPRRITGDEIAAFALVFGLEPSELMQPPEVVEDARLGALVGEAARAWERAISAVRELRAAAGAVGDHLHDHAPGSARYAATVSALGFADALVADDDSRPVTFPVTQHDRADTSGGLLDASDAVWAWEAAVRPWAGGAFVDATGRAADDDGISFPAARLFSEHLFELHIDDEAGES